MFLALQEAVTEAPFFTLDTSQPGDVLGAWLVCFLTLAVFSFLYKDNPFYKFAEHLFVGLGTAWFTMKYYEEGIVQPIHEYITSARAAGAAGEVFELGGYPLDTAWAIGFRVVAGIFALFLLSRLIAPNGWAPRWPLAIMVGVYAALKMTGETQSKLVLLLANAVAPVTDPNKLAWGELTQNPGWRIENWDMFFSFSMGIFFVGLICALLHFVFTFKRTRVLAGVSKVGVVTLMITFGSMFGFTVLGRIALLIERIDSLDGYTDPAYSLAGDSGGFLTMAFSPPILLGAVIALTLGVGALRGRGGDSA